MVFDNNPIIVDKLKKFFDSKNILKKKLKFYYLKIDPRSSLVILLKKTKNSQILFSENEKLENSIDITRVIKKDYFFVLMKIDLKKNFIR